MIPLQAKLLAPSAELARLIEENLSAKSLDFANLPGGQSHPGNPTWFTSGLKRLGYNGITWADFSGQDLDQRIEQTLEPFRETGTPLSWWLGPLSRPENLGRRLQAHGFHHNRDMIGMAANLEQLAEAAPLAPEYVFEPVATQAALETWMPLFMQTFGISASDNALALEVFSRLAFAPGSNWRHYAIRSAGRVVATSSLHLGAGIAGLYNVATHPTCREQGLGRAITLLTYKQARELGCSLGALQSTYPNALRLYHRMGFEIYCKFSIYQFNP
jgi:ribosomal protein S18 acetylase RimI-like enzyme